jgi:hypothetical protein
MSRFQTTAGERLQWRVIVRPQSAKDPLKSVSPLSWHLSHCQAPRDADAHCVDGRLRLELSGDPDGHCLLDESCPRCATSVAPSG